MKTFISTLLIMVLVFNTTILAVEYDDGLQSTFRESDTQIFSDVPESYWAFEYISEMVEKGVISGYLDGTYKPDDEVLRSEFAKMIVNTANLQIQTSTSSTFIDVNINDWFCPYVESAKEYLTGYSLPNGDLLYKPETPALREDIAIALVRLKGYDASVADQNDIRNKFIDFDEISDIAKNYIAIAVEHGLLSGYPDGTFKAMSSITRAEAATLLWRAYQNEEKILVTDTVTAPLPTISPESMPNKIPTPIPEPTPTLKPYIVDTVVDSVWNMRMLVADKNDVVHYIENDNLIKNSNGEVLDLKSDFKFKLEYDNKNFDFTLRDPYLAYDSFNDKLYLLGRQYIQDGSANKIVVYDIADYNNIKLIFDGENNQTAVNKRVMLRDVTYFEYDKYKIYFLPNGAMSFWCVSENNNTPEIWMINPTTNSIVKGGPEPFYPIIGNNCYQLWREGKYMYATDVSGGEPQVISIEGGVSNLIGSKDSLYSWVNEEGLITIDTQGYRHIAIPVSEIDAIDYRAIKIDEYQWQNISPNGSFVFEDEGSIRIIRKR